MSKSKNVVKKLTMILFTLVAVFAVGLTNVNAKTVTVETEEELINASKGIDSEINEIKLKNDITLTEFLKFHVVNDITLELNGRSLDTGTNTLAFEYGMSEYDESINNYHYGFNSKLTIKDSSSSKTGKILTRKSINFITYDTNHDEQIKKFGLTIEGGYYEIISSTPSFISLFTNDYYTNGRNITVDVKAKDAVFKVGDQMSLFGTSSDSDSDIKFNFNFESLKAMGLASKLGSNKLGKMKLDNVIDPNSKAYFQELPYTTGAPVLTEEDRNTLVEDFYSSGGSDPYIIIKKVNGFEINNVAINETYKETPSLNSISIKNMSGLDLQIQNVTVDSANFTIEGPSTSPTVSAGATNTDYKIKAKEGLPVGTYTARITVTDSNGNYTATVTLKVEKKNLTVGISGLDSTWVYGTTKTPTATGVDDLGAGDYKITYSKENNGSYEDIGTTLPKLVGKYKATLSITNPNYTAESSVDFEITPINTEVKVTSNDDTFEYDGLEHSNNGYTVSFDSATGNTLSTGDTVNAVVTGKVKDFSDTADGNNTIESVTITNAAGDDVTNCYDNIKKYAGKLTVTPKTTPIVVTANSDTMVYNGTELTKNTYTYTDGVLLAGDTLEATITGSQKYVGIADNKVTDVKIMRDGKDITDNYTFGTHLNGTLTVNEATQTFNVNENVNVLVNGSLTIDEIKAQLGSNIANYNIEFVSGTGTFDPTTGFTAGTTAGTVEMKAIALAIDENNDGTNEYAEATKTFYINVVNKENVTISGLTDNQEFTYDGTSKKPSGTIKVDGDKVPVDELEVKYTGTGYNSATAPTNAGSYTVTYRVKDENPTYVGSVTYTFTIKKAQLEKITIVKDTFEYTGSDITPTLNNNNSNIEVTGNTTAKNVSNNTITAKIIDKDNYEWKDGSNGDLTINWSITQATPDYTVPTGLTSVKGKVLADVALPTGFTWNAPATVLTVGTNTYKATFTPVDTTNYKTITDIDIEVDVKNTFNVITSVDSGNGTITPSKIGAVEGTKVEITFTPDTGYMIDKVLVNTVETTVTGNKIELTVNEEKEVKVSYKKIPFTVTVKDVDGATITPNGAVAVSYGETQEFTITANSGYKLVKVLVDGTDKTADMVGDTLKLTNITSNINLEVVVKGKFDVITSVPGGNGTITPSKIGVVEGTKVEITFTPDTGYMIDKVLVNTVETTVTGNKIELTVNEEKEVKVSYKKIPFTVTVKDVDGATITPNGAVAVSYGEDKEFTITANSGYKLVKVLVDGTDKTADMVGDTLKLTNITSDINLEVVVEKIVYEVTEGANQKYTITKNEEAKFRINADFRLFDEGKVYVDNELVDPKNYTAESGSTVITLKKEFVDTLSVGEHTLKVLFNDGGEAITTFNVAKVTVPTDNPQTGDNIGFYIISGILSIVGLAGAGIFYRRKQTN